MAMFIKFEKKKTTLFTSNTCPSIRKERNYLLVEPRIRKQTRRENSIEVSDLEATKFEYLTSRRDALKSVESRIDSSEEYRRQLNEGARGETDSIGMDSRREVGLIYEHSSARSLIKVTEGGGRGRGRGGQRQAGKVPLGLLSRALTVEQRSNERTYELVARATRRFHFAGAPATKRITGQRNYPRRYLQQFHGRFSAEREFSFLPSRVNRERIELPLSRRTVIYLAAGKTRSP